MNGDTLADNFVEGIGCGVLRKTGKLSRTAGGSQNIESISRARIISAGREGVGAAGEGSGRQFMSRAGSLSIKVPLETDSFALVGTAEDHAIRSSHVNRNWAGR